MFNDEIITCYRLILNNKNELLSIYESDVGWNLPGMHVHQDHQRELREYNIIPDVQMYQLVNCVHLKNIRTYYGLYFLRFTDNDKLSANNIVKSYFRWSQIVDLPLYKKI